MRDLKNLKTEAIFFLKNQNICSTVNWLSGLLIKQPEKQEVAQDDTAPVLHLFLYEVWHIVDVLQSNQPNIFGVLFENWLG